MNALRRLRDAQNVDNPDAAVYPYLSLGPLGEVIHKRLRQVVLIDEIDRPTSTFPTISSMCSTRSPS